MPFFSIRSLASLAIIFMLIILAACGGGSHNICPFSSNGPGCTCGSCPVNPGPESLYATSENNGGEVLAFTIDKQSGALGAATSVPGPGTSLGIAAAGTQFLYASDFQTAQIFGYSINATSGVLTAVNGSPFSTGQLSVPGGLTATQAVDFLYAADAIAVDAFSVNTTSGMLTAVSGSSSLLEGGTQVTLAPSGNFLFETNIAPPNGVLAFSVGSGGALSLIGGSPFTVPGQTGNSNPFGVVVDVSGKFVYETMSMTNQIAAWSLDSTSGVLTSVPGSPFSTGLLPTFMVTTGKFLFAMNSGAISAYTIDPTTGVLTAVNGSPFSAGVSAGLAIDSSGARLYAAAAAGNSIFAFTINSDGSLSPLAGSPFPATSAVLLTIVQMPSIGG